MNPPKSNGFSPEFNIKMEGHAFAHFQGPRDSESIKHLLEFIKTEKWRGILRITFVGNGGVNDVIFEEVKRITKAAGDGNIEVTS